MLSMDLARISEMSQSSLRNMNQLEGLDWTIRREIYREIGPYSDERAFQGRRNLSLRRHCGPWRGTSQALGAKHQRILKSKSNGSCMS